ncbi:hypothetical protein PMZ80_003162 [Knufia obscura]|uniref:Uncharacterized protein n=1 Tax=Knufia obscura TaxID=1635080 RepID=A0ABR0RTG9_9EURO|nr:hypothetical protein PMZ80_003162 [Knufia obscura]
MPTPQRHLSVDELSQRASTGLAIRRGEVKISEPLPSSYVHNGAEMDAGAYEQPTPRIEGTWPRSGGAGALHGRNESSTLPIHISRFTERTSLGPSLATSNMSSTPSKESATTPKKATGLKASIRRMSAGNTTDMSPVIPGVLIRAPLLESVPWVRALNSHAPSPHLRGESESVVQHKPSIGQLGKRRNTEPSLLMLPPEEHTQTQSEDPKEPQQKPSTERPRTAIKRDTPPPTQLKRRSRSADALADLLRSPAPKTSDRRDRAEEIAFWRNSIAVDPVPTLPNAQKPVTLKAHQTEHRPALTPSRPTRPSLEPIQSFDFGLHDGSNSARGASLQNRVNTLEVKLYDFEFALAKLQGTDVTRPNLPKKPSRRRSLRGVFPDSSDSSARESSSNDLSYLSTPSDRWQPSSPREQYRADRTSKATTIKPAHRRLPSSNSQTSSHSSIRFTKEQYDTLCTLIRDEKSARQQLEMQLMNLQKEVDILKSPVYAYVRPAKYPTPSPDESFHDSTINVTPRMLHRTPPLRPVCDLNETSRFSMSETEPDTDADDSYTEVYETPQENSFRFDTRRGSPPGMI